MNKRLNESNILECQAKFNLSYHVPYAHVCQQLVGFEGKDVLEVGGSLPKEFVFDYLNVKSWSAIETPDYETALKEVGGLTHKGTVVRDINDSSSLGFQNRELSQYNLFLENIENLPSEYYEKYDLIFSIAAFEHIHKFPQALEKMFLALKPGGQLFSMFSPIWSAPDGHHLPNITDQEGNSFNFGNSPIPPWGHLLMRPAELCQYLYQLTDKETADLIVYYIYNSPHINRFFTEDYVDFINQSSFTVKRLDLTFPATIDQETQLTLEKLYPGRKKFQNNGILLIVEKTLENDNSLKKSIISFNLKKESEKRIISLSEKSTSLDAVTIKNCTSIFFKDDSFLSRGGLPSEKQSSLGKSCFQIINFQPKAVQDDSENRPDSAKSSQSYTASLLDKRDKWQLKTPVCLIIFNRPDTTEKVFEAIRQAKPPKLFVIADGPRENKQEDAEKCAATRAIINRVDWECEVLTNYSDTNLGCRQRVSSGLDWVFDLVEEAIILEDDCLPHPTFFRFCEELLERYRHDERVMVIAGNNFQFGRNRTEYSYYFSRYSHCWGWTTWRRAWQHYDNEMKLWPQARYGNLLAEILQNSQAASYWSINFQGVYEGFNSWAYPWKFACWIHNGLTILPNINLVSNMGFAQEATHTTVINTFANMPTEAISFPLQHPPVVIRDTQADDFTEKIMFSGTWSNPAQMPTVDLVIHQALAQLNANNNTEALNLLEKAIATNPDVLALNYGKAIALARLGHTDEAIDCLDNLLAVMPANRKAQLLRDEINRLSVPELMKQATQALEANKNDFAFNLLVNAKSFKQPTLGLDYLRATCFLRLNQPSAALQALYEELRYFPDHAEAKNLLNQILSQYPQIASGKIEDAEFQELLGAIRPYTMLSEARLYSLFSLAKRICVENIPGNFVECGVAGGGSTALMAAVIKRYTTQPRLLYAFDSFEGMPVPTEQDKCDGIPANATGWGTGTCAAPEASVREICSELGVSNIVKTVKGYFEDTLPKMRDFVGMIAFLHMDSDWYESTKTILHNLYDQVVNDGLIQVDDYGHWDGCRQAFHEFESLRQIKFSLKPVDYSGVWFSTSEKFLES